MLSVNGTSFSSGAAVQWNGTALPTTFVSASQLTANVAANLVALAGTAAVNVLSGGQVSGPANFSIKQAPLTITSTSLPNGAVGQPYAVHLKASNGVAPYSWFLVGGALPGGLMNDSTGNINGTPTGGGISTFTMSVQDSSNPHRTSQQAFTITVAGPAGLVASPQSLVFSAKQGVNPAPQTISVTSTEPGIAVAYAVNAAASTGTLNGSSWVSVSPAGGNTPGTVSVSVTTSGLPPGSFGGSLSLSSAAGSIEVPVSLEISGPVEITNSSLPNAPVGEPYSEILIVSGLARPFSWGVSQGSLPPGMSLDGTTGTIAGTPTSTGTYLFTVQVVVSTGSATKALSITVTSLNNQAQPRIITTLAGTDFTFPRQPIPAANAPLGGVSAVTADQAGNVYIFDPDNAIITKVDPSGTLTVVAGNGTTGFSGDGGPATSAALGLISTGCGMATDPAGNLYFADAINYRVRKVDTRGTIVTVAGSGQPSSGTANGDGGPAVDATLLPVGVAVDLAGNLYISDGNRQIRKVNAAGTISTIASLGGCPATDLNGDIFLASTSIIQKITSSGVLTTVAGNGILSFSGDGGPATAASINMDDVESFAGITVDSSGNLYIADFVNQRVRKVNSSGIITTIAGNGASGLAGDGGSAVNAELNGPVGVAVNSAGTLFVADNGNQRVRQISASGVIGTFAGNGDYQFSGDGGPASAATLSAPGGIALDAEGNLFLTDGNRVRKIVPSGIITTVAGTGVPEFSGDGGPASLAGLTFPVAVASDFSGDLYISEYSHVRKVNSSGTISTVAGNGYFGSTPNGASALQTGLNPFGVAVDNSGNLFIYVADNSVREVFPGGAIVTIPIVGDTVDEFSIPYLTADSLGNIYLPASNAILKRTPGGTISVLAGNGVQGFGGDGGPALQASLAAPTSAAVDAAGNLYIADNGNYRIRMVTPAGAISTVAGNGTMGNSGDGSLATSAGLDPASIAVDAAGNIYVATGQKIRKILASPPTFLNPSPNGTASLSGTSGGKPASMNLSVIIQATDVSAAPVSAVPFAAQVTSGASWLSVSPQSGLTPGLLAVTADPSNLAAGSYAGAITITVPYASPSSRIVNVQFTVGAAIPASLSLDHNHLSFTYSNRSTARTQSITVSNAGGGPLPFTVSIVPNAGQTASWLSVTPTNGTATPATPAVLSVQADPSQLSPGTYTGTVTITSTAGSATVSVVMTISTNPLILLLSQTGLTFTAVQNGGVIPPQTLSVLNLGSGTLPWSVQTSVLGGVNNWLAATPGNGSTTAASSSGAPVVTVSVNPAALQSQPPGIYYGLVTVTSPNAANTPQAVVVVLQLLAAGTDLAPIVQPNSLVFTRAAGNSSPGSQTVQVYDPTGTSKSFRSGIALANGANWLVTLPTDATIPANQSVQMVVQPLVNNLSPGTYPGTVTLEFSDGRVSTVGIQFIVTGAGGAGPEIRTAGRTRPLDGSVVCPSTQLLPSLLTLGTGFSLPAGYPQGLEAQVLDNCGAPQVDGTVFVQFNDGEAPVKLQSLGNGVWDGTWPVGIQATSAVTLTVTAQNAAAITGQSQINGALGTTVLPPILTDQGIVSATASNPGAETPLAPGGLISIYGQLLSDGQVSAPAYAALPPALAGATVFIGAQTGPAAGQFQSMPIHMASPGQVNAVVPFEITPNTTQQLIFQRDSTYAAPVYVDVAAAQPGIFQNNQQAMILDANNNLIGPGNPAHAGDTIVIYCAGLGAVNSQPADGAVTPDGSSTVANPVSVSVGGSSVTASSAALVAGAVGMYQVTVTVPAGIPPGDAVQLSILVAGQTSPAVNFSVR
jgi:uncharacterized protein (TIGR03437 family)